VFEREGYHGASLERIAAEAGFTKGAVYSTFESKADVMLALVSARAARRRTEMEEVLAASPAAGSDPWSTLAELSQRFASQAAEERDWWTAVIEFMVVVGRDEELRARYAEHHDATREAVVALVRDWVQETGIRLSISPERLATAGMALNVGLTVESLLAPAEVPEKLYADAQVALRRGSIADGEPPR
jgi:AcrR family transcriptional regulator